MITLCIVPDGNRWVIEAAWTGGSERLDHRFETYGKAFSDARKMVKGVTRQGPDRESARSVVERVRRRGMNRFQEQVREFHRGIGQPTSPAEPALRNPVLRARLIAEEAVETVFALVGAVDGQRIVHDLLHKVLQSSTQRGETESDLCRAIDGLCDTVVVCMGGAEALGVDLEPFYDEVMGANMRKLDGPVDPETGKKLKPPGWVPPDIEGVLRSLA